MRRLLAFLLVLAPLGAVHATVSVDAQMGAPLNHVTCASAQSISFNLDQNRFAFFCATDSLTYSCTPSQDSSYTVDTGIITITCTGGAATGLVVNAMVDGVQNGSGNSDGVCNNAENFTFDLGKGKYTWTCNNGGGNTKVVSCWTSQEKSNFSLASNQFNMDCVTLYSRNSFEDFEEPPEAPL